MAESNYYRTRFKHHSEKRGQKLKPPWSGRIKVVLNLQSMPPGLRVVMTFYFCSISELSSGFVSINSIPRSRMAGWYSSERFEPEIMRSMTSREQAERKALTSCHRWYHVPPGWQCLPKQKLSHQNLQVHRSHPIQSELLRREFGELATGAVKNLNLCGRFLEIFRTWRRCRWF